MIDEARNHEREDSWNNLQLMFHNAKLIQKYVVFNFATTKFHSKVILLL
jgi:hypothetical protein